jgi:uncharacterized membrane protein YoaK (UPF0700 family)
MHVPRPGAKNQNYKGSRQPFDESELTARTGARKVSEARRRDQESGEDDVFNAAQLRRRERNLLVLPPPERRSGAVQLGESERTISTRPLASWVGETKVISSDIGPVEVPFGSELVGATLLSAIAGYVDAAGFLSLFGMFTAHITGDLIAGTAVMSGHISRALAIKLAAVPIFMLSVALATLVTRAVRHRGGAPVVSLLGLMTGALGIFCAAGVFLQPFMNGPDNWAVAVVGSTGVAAMAIQNMLMRDALSGWSPTTIMTGNLTRVSIHMVEYAFPPSEADTIKRASVREEATNHLMKVGLPLLGFVAGASLSAWLTRMLGLLSIALPTAVLGALTVWHWRRARKMAENE